MKRKYDHISPVMEDLHWLPIWERINYKVLPLTYKSLIGLAPQYLIDLLEHRTECITRRDNKNLLVNPQVRTVTFCGRTFKNVAPELWNNIPDSLRLSTSVNSLREDLRLFFLTLCTHHAR